MLVRAAGAGSFASAARTRHLTPSAVSRGISDLEREPKSGRRPRIRRGQAIDHVHADRRFRPEHHVFVEGAARACLSSARSRCCERTAARAAARRIHSARSTSRRLRSSAPYFSSCVTRTPAYGSFIAEVR
ncbi:LysR family transcriptional regulator [Bradyrhizobium vignae]|uniref:LysR family transcriptional regulator n=1 Tax=Bradyrhizobium vignae TaxID=1549949 RepID=A0ABS3ZVF2_9BRAD|nr:LysR family transcriptional regulator [Bradyrhizobium vignae]MBP0112137.1 LysR family transcriptional regulator [Bradyrhizobium vignae]